jgi:hypothetical protein
MFQASWRAGELSPWTSPFSLPSALTKELNRDRVYSADGNGRELVEMVFPKVCVVSM